MYHISKNTLEETLIALEDYMVELEDQSNSSKLKEVRELYFKIKEETGHKWEVNNDS